MPTKYRTSKLKPRRLATIITVIAAMMVLSVTTGAEAYSTDSRTKYSCTVNYGYGVNYAGQNQAAISSGDSDCWFVEADLFNNGYFVSSSSDSSNYFNAITTTSSAANNANYTARSDNGLYWGFGPYWF